MGRSVLGHSGDGGTNYTYIGELSRSKFINVSVEPGHIDRAAPETGLAIGTPVLWIFGSGRYRMSDIYLAVMPPAGLRLYRRYSISPETDGVQTKPLPPRYFVPAMWASFRFAGTAISVAGWRCSTAAIRAAFSCTARSIHGDPGPSSRS